MLNYPCAINTQSEISARKADNFVLNTNEFQIVLLSIWKAIKIVCVDSWKKYSVWEKNTKILSPNVWALSFYYQLSAFLYMYIQLFVNAKW